MKINFIHIVFAVLFLASAGGFAQEKYTDEEIGFDREKEKAFLTNIGVDKENLDAQIAYRRLGFLENFKQLNSYNKSIKNQVVLKNNLNDPCSSFPNGIDGTFESCESIAHQTTPPNGEVTCSGWSNYDITPDTWKFPVSFPSNSVFSNNIVPSPNGGGVFVGVSAGVGEAFSVSVSNLEVGEKYLLKFYQSHGTNFQSSLPNDYVRWKLTFGSETLYGDDILITEFPTWEEQFFEFTATATNQDLIIQGARGELQSGAYFHIYSLIDGIEFFKVIGDIEADGNLCINQSIPFSFNTPDPAEINSYSWTFYDTNGAILFTSANSQPNYTYQNSGSYNVSLNITSNDGCSYDFLDNFVIDECEPCDTHFNFNFKFSNAGGVTNAEQENLANGIISFVNNTLNDNLFITTYDDAGNGARATVIQQNYDSPFPNATTNGSNETQGGFFRIQNDYYTNTFKNIAEKIITTTSVNIPINVSFFFISHDKFNTSINDIKAAYDNLLTSKSNKVFFVFMDEGYVRDLSTSTDLTPFEFIEDLKGSAPVNFNSTNSILNSDYITYTKATIGDPGFPSTLSNFLMDAYNEVLVSDCTDCTEEITDITIHECIQQQSPSITGSLCTNNQYCFDWVDNGSDTSGANFLWEVYDTDGTTVLYTSTSSSPSYSFTNIGNFEVSLTITYANDCVAEYTETLVVGDCDPCDDVVLVIDESGSISDEEAIQLKAGLNRFIEDQLDLNLNISIIGMSHSDTDERTGSNPAMGNHIIREKVTPDTKSNLFDPWIANYGNRNGASGISGNSDYWASALSVVNDLQITPELVVIFTDGSQTENITNLQTEINAIRDNSNLYVYGIGSGYYVNGEPDFGGNDPNAGALVANDVVYSLRTSLDYLFGDSDPIADDPTVNSTNFLNSDYYRYDDFSKLSIGTTILSNQLSHSGILCTETIDVCYDCYTFQPEINEKYWISGWVKEDLNTQVTTYTNASLRLLFINASDSEIDNTEVVLYPSGDIIDGWQRIAGKFNVHPDTVTFEIELDNSSANVPVYFDDIRVHPLNGSMKSFVYDPITYRLMAELDENNYSTYYEYDNEGGLVRVKKETSKGVKTIQETRSGTVIKKDN